MQNFKQETTKAATRDNMCEVHVQFPQGLETLKLPDPDIVSHWVDHNERVMWVDYDIDEGVFAIIKNILQFNRDDRGIPTADRKPIKLFINSPGGSVPAGFSLMDVILTSQTPVWTINMGKAYSMGFLILLASDKRYGTQNSSYLLHDGSGFVCDSAAKLRDYMDFSAQTESRIKNFVVSRTNISAEKYDERYRYEWYQYAEEALELGVIHGIVGKDIQLEDLL